PQNDVTLKMPAFEWVHVQLHQQKGMISLSPPTICNSAMPVSALICFCTCPDADSAERIATALVAERLAACVNLLPGLRSVYRWQRKVEAAAEVLLLVKTSAEAYPALQERLRQLHPYELPELLAVEAASGLPEYLQWLAAESRPVN
ncbi:MULTISPECIES: divalent-cation tolerance protein CutA, partial [Enterobacteriaceae]